MNQNQVVTTPTPTSENTILLTLPNISFGENECEESSEKNGSNNVVTPTVTHKELELDYTVIGKQIQGQLESVGETDAPEEEEYFCHQHLTNKERLSPELQDVYKLLMQLPTFSHSSWSGFNKNNTVAGQKSSTFSRVGNNKRKSSSVVKTRKNGITTGKANLKFEMDPNYTNNETDFLNDQEDMKPDESQNKQPRREVVKMHSINLYQSILPSSLFARRKTYK